MYVLTANQASRKSSPLPPTSHERISKKTLNAWIPLKVLSTASTLTFTSRSMDPNSTPSSSARARSWAAALLASDKQGNRILIITEPNYARLFFSKKLLICGRANILLDILLPGYGHDVWVDEDHDCDCLFCARVLFYLVLWAIFFCP